MYIYTNLVTITGSHLYGVQVRLLFVWAGDGAGGEVRRFKDNRILVLVHSTKRKSASLPVSGATDGASPKVVPCTQKKKPNGVATSVLENGQRALVVVRR